MAMTAVIGGRFFYPTQAILQPGRRRQCHPPYHTNSIRRALTSDRSRGPKDVIRLLQSVTHWPPALPGEKAPALRRGPFLHKTNKRER